MAIQRSTLVTKAQELMNTERLDYATAAKRAKETMTATTPVTPAPTTPVATTPTQPGLSAKDAQGFIAGTPIYNQGNAGGWGIEDPMNTRYQNRASTNVNQQQLIDNQNKVQSQNQPIVNAPVDQTTGLSKPLEPSSTPTAPIQAEVKAPEPIKTEVASSTAKIEPVIDYNVSAGREGEIQDNIAKITQANPNLLKDRNAYNQAFGYETADAGKKALLDSNFSGQVKPSQDDIFNSMRQGVSVGDPKSTEFRQAQARINTFKKYSVYDTASLATSLQSWDLLVGTKAYNDLVSDPTMALKIQKAQAFVKKDQGIDYETMGTKASADIFAQYPTVGNAVADGNISTEEYNQLTNNAEVSAQSRKANEANKEYQTLYRTYQGIKEDVDKEYGGKETTDSFKAKIVADRKLGIKKSLDTAYDNATYETGIYKDLKADATALLAQNMELYKTEQANKAQIASEQRQLQYQKDLLQYKSDFERQQAEMALNDPQTQIANTMKEFADMGIVAQGSLASKVAEANDVIAKGGTLGQYINKLRSDYMAKPEYKKMQALQQGQLSDVQKMSMSQNFDLQKMGMEQDFQMKIAQAKNVTDNKWTKLDDGLYTNEAGEIITADELKNAKLMGNSNLTKQVGEEGGECGVYASRGVGMSSTPGGNNKDKRKEAFADTIPQVGGMVFFGGAGYDQKYGHIGIVTGVNQDGTIQVKDSNYGNDGKVQVRTVPASTATGFYNNTPLAQSVNAGTQATTGQYTDQNINDLAYLTELQEKNPTQAAKDMKELGYSARDLANYKAGNLPLTEKQKNTSTEVMNAIKDLVDPDKYEWNDAVGKFDPKRLIGTQDAEDATIAINNLVAKLTLPNLGVLKGPMSDKDIQFIKEASSKLATTQSNDSFERNLIDAYNLSARRAGMQEITKLSDISTGTKKGTVGGELNYSKYE